MKPLLISALLLFFVSTAFAQGSFVTISNGGGFTGAVTAYKVYKDGTVLKGKGIPLNYTETARLKRSKAKKYCKRIKTQVASLPDFNHPGNVYYSIAIVDEGQERKVVWGDSKYPVSEEVLKLYNDMLTAFSHLSFTTIVQQH